MVVDIMLSFFFISLTNIILSEHLRFKIVHGKRFKAQNVKFNNGSSSFSSKALIYFGSAHIFYQRKKSYNTKKEI